MNLRRLTARATVAGVSTAVAAGALVGLGASAASAEEATTTYTCVQKDYGLSYDFAVTVTQTPATQLSWAGQAVKKGKLGELTASASVPAEAAGLLGAAGITGARSDDFALGLGSGKAPFPISGSFVPADGGAATWEASGTNDAFVAPNPSSVTATLPASFTIITAEEGDGLRLNCTVASGETAGTLWSATLAKQTSKTTAKSVKGKVGKAVKLPVKVKGNAGPATSGKVLIKKGKKTVGKAKVKNGKAVVKKLKGLKKGKNKLSVLYSGSKSFSASKTKVVVKLT